MFRSQRGSAAAWVVLALILLVAAAVVLYLTVFKGDDEKAESPGAGDAAATQSQQNVDNASGQGGTGGGSTDTGTGQGQGTGQGSGQVAPGSNVREPVTAAVPPIESGEEAYLAVKGASPEVLDWYWAVDDPRYEATDSGSYYVVRLYSVVPAEGSSPEHQADFGRYRVDKQTGTVSEMAK